MRRLPIEQRDARTGVSFERLEPCEEKLSCTVLMARGRVNRLRLPSA